MSLPTPYWLLPNANRGLASTLDDLPIKRDFILLSTADHDETGLYLAAWNAANPADESQDVAQPTDLTTWSMAFWKEVGGVLQPLLTITQTPTVNGSFLQVSIRDLATADQGHANSWGSGVSHGWWSRRTGFPARPCGVVSRTGKCARPTASGS